MKADGEVIGGCFQFAGRVVHGTIFQIDFTYDGGVFGLEGGDDIVKALAEFRVVFRRVEREIFHRFGLRGATAVKVDDAIAEDAVEPGDHVFVFAQGAGRFHGLEEAVLDNIGGEVRVGDAFAGESLKLIQVREQALFEFSHGSVARRSVLFELVIVIRQRRKEADEHGGGERLPVERIVQWHPTAGKHQIGGIGGEFHAEHGDEAHGECELQSSLPGEAFLEAQDGAFEKDGGNQAATIARDMVSHMETCG